jgi:predicted house-cleaning NTP pyrophosphatase (Maf/HAM1 superfamily)
VADTALHKVLEVDERLSKDEATRPDIVIGADTMVVLGDKMYGKPKTPEVAFRMLSE